MAENARPPVAVRIVRPFETEEAFLESELETVGKTSVILIGAHSRPTGVILRFEVTLASGATILRGEGRVLAHKENAFRGQPGLALRFTRLDPKSKALVDRAASIREARLAGDAGRVAPAEAAPPAPSSASSVSDPPPAAARSAPPAPARSTPPSTSARPSAPPPQDPTSLPPDPVLAHILTAPTPPPPVADGRGKKADRRRSTAPDRRSERPTNAPPEPSAQEGTTPPPEPLAPLVEGGASESANPHAMATVAPTAAHGASPYAAPTVAPAPEARTAPAPEARTAPAPESEAPSAPQAITSLPSVFDGAARSLPPPADRDALLGRLRQRAAGLTDEQKAAILRSS
ncbi:MAG: hypothetical protein KF795_25615 [Labilithrix sp.]|nr:hypothetical protein [Labilithrix sp.]